MSEETASFYFASLSSICGGPSSIVDIATAYGLDGPGIEFR